MVKDKWCVSIQKELVIVSSAPLDKRLAQGKWHTTVANVWIRGKLSLSAPAKVDHNLDART